MRKRPGEEDLEKADTYHLLRRKQYMSEDQSRVDPTWVTRLCLSSSICIESALYKAKVFWRGSIKHSLQLPFTWLDPA